MARTALITGNWKMHTTLQEAEALVRALKDSITDDAVEVVLCPPFTALVSVGKAVDGSPFALGAQDMFWEQAGAFTGEISPVMLRDVGCRYVIIGHSERRTHFGDTDEVVHRKLAAAVANSLTPIVCVGETLTDREHGKTFDVLTRQLRAAFVGCSGWDCARIILAYEPVWAIGTGQNATPEQAQDAHQFIRGWITKQCGAQVGETMRIQYGGSVTAANAASLLQQADVDGALVGGASLKPEAFSAIVHAAAQVKPVHGVGR